MHDLKLAFCDPYSNNIPERMQLLSEIFLPRVTTLRETPKTRHPVHIPDSHYIDLFYFFAYPRIFHSQSLEYLRGAKEYLLAARTNGINDRNNILRGRRKAHTFQSTSKKYDTWLSTHSLDVLCCAAIRFSQLSRNRALFFSSLSSPSFFFFFPNKHNFFSRRQRGRSSTNEGTPWRIRLGEAEEVIERRGKWAKRVEKRANSKVQRLFYVIFPLWPP